MAELLYNWSRLKRLERIELVSIVTLIPGSYILNALLERIGLPSMLGYSTSIWFATVFILDIVVMSFRCPRCERKFFYRTLFKNRITSKCVHCGLPKWAYEGQSPEQFKRLADPASPGIASG
jgi:DNA-directed RNA polymerase subunit RPC12/RpoP